MSRTVRTKEDFNNALNEDVEVIRVKGDVANEIAKRYHKNAKGNKASNAGIVLGLFWTPLLFAGVVGKVANHKLNKYKMEVISDNEVVLTMKDSVGSRII